MLSRALGFGLGIPFINGNLGPPAVANQTIEMGQKTRAFMGDAPIANGGGGLTSATIDSGSLNATTHFQFEVYNGVAYLQAKVNGGLTNTPYTLNCTFTGPSGSDTATLTVNTSGTTDNGADLTKSFSVAPSSIGLSWHLTDTLSLTGAGSPQFGDFILMRGGTYDGTGEDPARSVQFGGTFNPPDQFLEVPVGEPAGHRGTDTVDYSGGTINWVTIQPHSSMDSVNINRLYLQCNSAGTSGFTGLKITGITFTRSDSSFDQSIFVDSLTGSTLTDGAYLIMRNNAWDGPVVVEDCSFIGLQDMSGYSDIPVFIGILGAIGGSDDWSKVIVRNCVFDNVWNAVVATTGSTSTHPNLEIIGNEVTNCWGDTFFLKHGDNVKVNWNYVYDTKSAYLALGPFYNVDFWDSPIHKDFIHARNTSSGAANAANFQAIGNRYFRAIGTGAAYPGYTSDGPSNYDGESGMAIFIESPSSSGTYTNPIVAGNFLVGEHPPNAIVFNTTSGGFIEGNTVVSHDPGNYGGASIFDQTIKLNASTAGTWVQGNIAEDIDDTGTGNTVNHNTIISRTSGAGVLDKVSTFEDAYDVQGMELPGEDTYITNFVIKSTSEAYTSNPHIGTKDVDYDNRSLSLPWYDGMTLFMDFVSGVYRGAQVSDLTVTRTTSGTALNSAGEIESFASGVARITDLGLLIEEARTNSALRSEEFDNASWTKSNVTVSANSTTSPDTTTNADTLTASAGNGTCTQGVTTTAISWTFSVWLKRLTGTGNVQITMDGTTWVTQTINSSAWTRCSVTQTGVSGTSNPGIRIVTSGDAVYAFGAQAEAGAYATSYIPTTTATVARNADNIALTSTAFSSWYGSPTGGTLYGEATFQSPSSGMANNAVLLFISDGTVGHRYGMFRQISTTNMSNRITNGVGVNPGDIASIITVNSVTKVAIACAIGANQGIACVNGTLSTASSPAGSMPVVNRLSLGQSEGGGAGFLNGYLRRVHFYPSRLSNSDLQALTT